MRPVRKWETALLIVLAGGIACGAPSTPSASQQAGVPASDTPPVASSEAPTASPDVEPRLAVLRDGAFHILSLAGAEVEAWPAPGLEFPGVGTIQAAGGALYYLVPSEGVFRLTAEGSTLLTFTTMPGLEAFAVAPDESRIAWSGYQSNEASLEGQLLTASMDGSMAQEVAASSSDDEISEYFIPRPVRWSSSGDLLYSWQITGIGGYILFFGYSSFYLHSPSGGDTALTGLENGVCWSDVSSDLAYAVGSCRAVPADPRQMREVELASGMESVFPLLPEEGVQGGAEYSPSGSQLAYLVARSNPEDEFGQIALRGRRGELPTSIASTPGYFSRVEWIDEQRMLVSIWGTAVNTVEVVAVSGERTPIAEGEWGTVLR